MTHPDDAERDDVWLGIDLGTQSVRALAVTGHGAVMGAGTSPLTSHRDGPRHEQDPQKWWDAVCSATQAALAGIEPGAVRGVAVDGTSGTILLADRRGDALTPALMYDDMRAAAEVPRINDAGRELWARLGYQQMQPAWALPKLLWLIRAYPELPRGARALHQTDYVNRRLSGTDVASDLNTCLKTGADLIEETWPADVLADLDVPEDLLPALVRPGTPIGTVCAAAALETGIPAGTTVVSGTTDGCAAQLGAGALRPGSWNSVLGTTLVLKGVTSQLLKDPLGVVYSHRAPDGGWLPGGASSTGAGILTRNYPGRDLDDLNRRAKDHEPATQVAYPLASPGERFPFVAPQASGFVIGTASGEADAYAALLQGVGFIERLCFDYLDLLGARQDGDLVLTGGATRSQYWCQLRADILGRPVVLPENAEPALGAAVLAASPGRSVADVAASMVAIRLRIEPRPGARTRYDGPYLRLVDELRHRGWLRPEAADHAIERAAR